eukprot:jgi/Tetstr1/430177/TSEL_020008.t1
MLPKDGSELTETWYKVEQCLHVHDIKKYIVHCCACDEHRYDHSLDGDWSYDDRCPRYNLTRWTPESLRHPRRATPQPRKFYYDFNVCEMKKMDMRMALVTLTSDFSMLAPPMLPSAGTSGGVVCADWTCEDYRHFAETVAVLVLGDVFDSEEHQHLAVMWHMLQGAVIGYLRDCEECDAPSDSEECRRANLYIKKQRETWDEQWVPTDEYGKQALLRDRRAEVKQHDNDVYVGDVLYFREVTHTSPSVPDLTLAVCRLYAAGRMVIGSPLGTGVSQSKAPLRPNVRTGHDAFPVALKHIEEKLCCFYVDPDMFRGQATNIHIRVHPKQPHGEHAFGYAFADILNQTRCDMGTGVKNASVDVPSLAVSKIPGRESTLKATDKALLSDVFDECWSCDTQTRIPYPLKKTPRFPIAASPYVERICYATFNYRAGYTTANHIYAKETVLPAFREYTPSPFLPTPLRPSLWVVLTVHLVIYRKHGNVRNYLARHYFLDEGKDDQGDLRPVLTFGGKPIVSIVQRNKVVSPPLAGTAVSPKLRGLVGVLAQQQKTVGGIITHNTNAVKNLHFPAEVWAGVAEALGQWMPP